MNKLVIKKNTAWQPREKKVGKGPGSAKNLAKVSSCRYIFKEMCKRSKIFEYTNDSSEFKSDFQMQRWYKGK